MFGCSDPVQSTLHLPHEPGPVDVLELKQGLSIFGQTLARRQRFQALSCSGVSE